MSGLIEQFADLAADVVAAPAGLGGVRVVAVDGPAGSGKTTFADRLAVALRTLGADVALVHTDDLLEGWSDLLGYWPRLREWVLQPLSSGQSGRYRRYDWDSGRFGDSWHPVPVPDVLVVEGVASIGAVEGVGLILGIYVVASRDLRFTRGIARDGEAMRESWLRWMAAEDAYYARHDIQARADIVVDGAPGPGRHDPTKEFVRLR